MNDKYIITPYRAHIEGLEYDLKVYKKQLKVLIKIVHFLTHKTFRITWRQVLLLII